MSTAGVLSPAFVTTDTLLRYDPVANSWTNLGSAGSGLGNYGGVSPLGTGQLLITDGADATGVSTTTTHIFTISGGTFSAGPAMTTSRAGHAQGTLSDGRVLVADGFDTATTATTAVELLTNSCATPSATPTFTATSTATATATATATTTASATPTGTCTPGGGGTPGPWATGTTGPPLRYRAGGTTDGTSVYVYGGGNDVGAFLNDLWKWNPGTGAWTQLANMPTGKQNIQGAYYNGKIYVPGGYIGSHITENAIYDIASNTWTTGAPLPAPQSGSNVAFNGKIYNFGGNPGPSATTSIYDIASNTWTTGAPMPAATTYGRAVVSGNFAYVVGGITTVTVNTVFRYDLAGNTWTTMTPLQTARTSEELMASPDGTSLYAVMGGDATFFTGVPQAQSVEIYNIAGNSWTYGNPVVQKAAGPGGGLAGGKLMVEGGVDGAVYFNTVQVSTLTGGGGCGTPSATPTNTATSTPTATATGSPTCTPGNIIGNGDFETGAFPPWVIDGSSDAPVISTAPGAQRDFLGIGGQRQWAGTAGRQLILSAVHSTCWRRHAELLALGLHHRQHYVRLAGCLHHGFLRHHPGNDLPSVSKWEHVDQPAGGHDALCGADGSHQVPGASGWLRR